MWQSVHTPTLSGGGGSRNTQTYSGQNTSYRYSGRQHMMTSPCDVYGGEHVTSSQQFYDSSWWNTRANQGYGNSEHWKCMFDIGIDRIPISKLFM